MSNCTRFLQFLRMFFAELRSSHAVSPELQNFGIGESATCSARESEPCRSLSSRMLRLGADVVSGRLLPSETCAEPLPVRESPLSRRERVRVRGRFPQSGSFFPVIALFCIGLAGKDDGGKQESPHPGPLPKERGPLLESGVMQGSPRGRGLEPAPYTIQRIDTIRG